MAALYRNILIAIVATSLSSLSAAQMTRDWGTYYGANFIDDGFSVATDVSGNVYLTGQTASNDSIAMNGHQMIHGGGGDAFLVKFNSAGERQWGTYYGSSGSDEGFAVATDPFGNVFVAGTTTSLENIAYEGHQDQPGGVGPSRQAFLVKFDPDGVRQWGTYYGGAEDNEGLGCATDLNGNVYLTGLTRSPTHIAFNGFQNEHSSGGNEDAFLVKFDPNGIRLWATYYGTSSHDRGYACATDAEGNVYMSGVTESDSIIAYNGHQNTRGGMTDAFLVKFASDGNRLWSTYYGGSLAEFGYHCTTDPAGNVYMAGYTTSPSAIADAGHQSTIGGQRDAFLVKFDPQGIRQWGTYYGGHLDEYGYQCATDANGNAYLTGNTLSPGNISSNGNAGEQPPRDRLDERRASSEQGNTSLAHARSSLCLKKLHIMLAHVIE